VLNKDKIVLSIIGDGPDAPVMLARFWARIHSCLDQLGLVDYLYAFWLVFGVRDGQRKVAGDVETIGIVVSITQRRKKTIVFVVLFHEGLRWACCSWAGPVTRAGSWADCWAATWAASVHQVSSSSLYLLFYFLFPFLFSVLQFCFWFLFEFHI
jgi:hypothetical protein